MLTIKENLNLHPVISFFILVYGLSAPFWLIQLFIDTTDLPLSIPITDVAAVFTPVAAACLLIYNERGRNGIIELLLRTFDFKKLSLLWWVVAVFLPLLIFLLVYLFLELNHYVIPKLTLLSIFDMLIVLAFFYIGAAAEEIAYSGFVIDKLQAKFTALTTSFLIGVPWIVWHYPSILHQGRDLNFIVWGTFGTIAFRTILVWLYNNTNGCVAACVVVHCLYNTGRVIFPQSSNNNLLVDAPHIHYGVIVVIAVFIVILGGKRQWRISGE